MKEIELKGGKSTNNVIRRGSNVHRSKGSHSPFVHALLKFLEMKNLNFVPKFLGEDENDREILTYINGEVPKELKVFEDFQLKAAAYLIRNFHQATERCLLASNNEIVCHNDLTPCNFVFVNSIPIAIIDFDAAAPGTRLRDLGYAVWQWCDLGNENISLETQAIRIKMFLSSYGISKFREILPSILIRQEELIKFCQKKSEVDPVWKKSLAWGKNRHVWLLKNLKSLEILLA